MPLNRGDKVHLLNETGECVVLSVEGAFAMVQDEHGFEWRVQCSQLVEIKGKEAILKRILETEPDDKDEVVSLPKVKSTPKKPDEVLEVDLHIHELTANHKHMTNHQIVTLQMQHFHQALTTARNSGVRKLIAIHGVGKGVLRAEIRNALSSIERCSYEDASFLEYGRGATEIRLW